MFERGCVQRAGQIGLHAQAGYRRRCAGAGGFEIPRTFSVFTIAIAAEKAADPPRVARMQARRAAIIVVLSCVRLRREASLDVLIRHY